jgi:SAM-dependent methyltransferase
MDVHRPEAKINDPKYTFYPESRFGGYTDVDQVVTFYTRVRALIKPTDHLLDVGCGRGKQADDPIPTRRQLKTLTGAGANLLGVDVDPAAAQNPLLDEFRLIGPDGRWPVDDDSIDLTVSDYVLEHVDRPDQFFDECRRVLRPGGYLCMRTTNALSYFGIAARLAPNPAHAALIDRLYVDPRDKRDVFATSYRCNTIRSIRRALDRVDFEHCVYGYQSDPAHFGFFKPLYALGVLHQRHAPKVIKPAVFVFARRR